MQDIFQNTTSWQNSVLVIFCTDGWRQGKEALMIYFKREMDCLACPETFPVSCFLVAVKTNVQAFSHFCSPVMPCHPPAGLVHLRQSEEGEDGLPPFGPMLSSGPGRSGSYCRRCMFFCPTLAVLEQHKLTCTADLPVEGRPAPPAAIASSSYGEVDDTNSNEGREVVALSNKEGQLGSPVDNKPFKCSRCGRGYQLAQSLQRHRWSCDRSRPMPCTLCGQVYYRSDSLQTHMRSYHSLDSRLAVSRPAQLEQAMFLPIDDESH